MKNTHVAALLATTACIVSSVAYAQGPSAEADPSMALGEIVVTAQKRAQNLQDVPIAISALSSDYLEQREITLVSGLSGLAPNLKVDTAGANQTTSVIAIRGGVQGNPQIYFEPSVGVYMDGVYIAKAQGSLFDIADMERIEVLRGPQGTLYGRNAVAGAVNIVTRKPSGELGGKIEASYGNYDYWRLRGSLNLPSFGIFSAKLSGQVAQRDGFYKVSGNAHTNEAASLDSKSGMIQVRAEPSDTLKLDYMFDLSVNSQQAGYAQTIAGTGVLTPFAMPRKREKDVSFDGRNTEYAKNWGHALTATLDLDSIGEVKSITALRKQKYRDTLDLDGSPVNLAYSSRVSDYEQFSQELQLAGNTGRLNYVGGLYYFEDDGFVRNPQSYFFDASRTDSRFGFTTKAYAAYAQVDYGLTDALTITGGLRYTHEKKTIERYLARLGTVPTVVVDLPAGAAEPAKFEKLSPTATLAYEFSRDFNVYARYAQGFRSGGFNGVASTTNDILRVFEPQIEDTYEIGVKSRLLDNRLQLNVAAFQNNLKDLQLSVFVPGLSAASILVNAGKARMRGLEVEALASPTDRLMLQASFGYLHGKYLEYIDGGVDVADNRSFQHAPKYTMSFSVDWTAMDNELGKLNLIADLTKVSKYHVYASPLVPESPAQRPADFTRSPGRLMLDMRAVLSDIQMGGTTATVTLWGKNLLNEDDPTFFIDFGANFLGLATANFPEPRTYGVTLNVKF